MSEEIFKFMSDIKSFIFCFKSFKTKITYDFIESYHFLCQSAQTSTFIDNKSGFNDF